MSMFGIDTVNVHPADAKQWNNKSRKKETKRGNGNQRWGICICTEDEERDCGKVRLVATWKQGRDVVAKKERVDGLVPSEKNVGSVH